MLALSLLFEEIETSSRNPKLVDLLLILRPRALGTGQGGILRGNIKRMIFLLKEQLNLQYTQSHKTNLGIEGKLEPMLLIIVRWNSEGGCPGSAAWTITTMKMMIMIMTMMAIVAARTLEVSNLHCERSSKKDRRPATPGTRSSYQLTSSGWEPPIKSFHLQSFPSHVSKEENKL